MRVTVEALLAKLDAILEAENRALAHMDLGAVAALVADKNAIAEQLQAALSACGKEEVRTLMQRRGTMLSSAIGDNKALLERAMRVQRRMVGLIAAASEPAPALYSRRGLQAGVTHKPRAMMADA